MLYLVLGPVSQPEESACNAFFSGLFHRYAQNGNWSILGSKLKLSFLQNKFIRRMNQLLD